MGPAEMEHIARLMKECVMDNKEVKAEVHAFRAKYAEVKYSFDDRQ